MDFPDPEFSTYRRVDASGRNTEALSDSGSALGVVEVCVGAGHEEGREGNKFEHLDVFVQVGINKSQKDVMKMLDFTSQFIPLLENCSQVITELRR